MTRRSVGLCLLMAALLFFGAAYVPVQAQDMEFAYVRMDASSPEEFNEAINVLEGRGAVIRHRIYPIAAMGLMEQSSRFLMHGIDGVRTVFVGKIAEDYIAAMERREALLAKAYNNIYFPSTSRATSESRPEFEPVPIDPEPLLPPQEYVDALKAPWQGAGSPPPFPQATSEFMLGHIAVAAILPESAPGFGSHDWLNSEEEKATEELISAMDWWARHSPGQELTFSYEINYAVPVLVEPMEDGQNQIEEVWAGQSLTHLGYAGRTHFDQSRQYINDMRANYNADWGVVIFVLHGFAGQWFDMMGSALAYAYLGGPLNVNVYSNGYLGPEKLDRVIAHETGHSFYTLDEYPVAPVSCSSRSGYLNVENANKQQGGPTCKSDVPCVMRGGSQPTPFDILEPCYYTCGQVGWWDGDGDGIPDILDTEPKVDRLILATDHKEGSVADTVFAEAATLEGTVSAVPIENRNSRSFVKEFNFTVEDVGAEYRVNGGPWTPCEPSDGRFDETIEGYRFTLADLVPWLVHTVDVRAITVHGNVTPDDALISLKVVFGYEASPPMALLTSSPAKPPFSIKFQPVAPSGAVGLMVPVEVAVYDPMGRKLRTLESGEFQTGRVYSTDWDGRDSEGRLISPGVYAIAMNSQGEIRSRKVLVVQ